MISVLLEPEVDAEYFICVGVELGFCMDPVLTPMRARDAAVGAIKCEDDGYEDGMVFFDVEVEVPLDLVAMANGFSVVTFALASEEAVGV